jgi:hypothetical protein
MLTRTFDYEAAGRNQDADGSAFIDAALRGVLDRFDFPYTSIDSNDDTAEAIVEQVMARIRP